MDDTTRSAPLIAKILVSLIAIGAAATYVWYRQQTANPPAAPQTAEDNSQEVTAAQQTSTQSPANDASIVANDEAKPSPTLISSTKRPLIDLGLSIEGNDSDKTEALDEQVLIMSSKFGPITISPRHKDQTNITPEPDIVDDDLPVEDDKPSNELP